MALAITITILLILAGITISTITGRDGILLKTNNATEALNREEVIKLAQMDIFNEQMNNNEDFTEEQLKKILAKYFNYDPASQLPKDLSTLILTTKDGKYNDILASEIYSENFSTNKKTVGSIKEAKKLVDGNTIITSDDNVKVTIPAGFTIPEESPNNAKEGIIITDSINESTGKSDGNEFVWIPVDYDLKVVGTGKIMAKESRAENYEGKDDKGRTNYEGVLYDFTETNSVEISSESDGQGTSGYREPDSNLWHDGSHGEDTFLKKIRDKLIEEAERYTDHATFIKTMQEDYNEMIESVKIYGGFYVARYEMSMEEMVENVATNKPTSKVGLATNSLNWKVSRRWYGLYSCAKKYTNTKNSVKSSMIWGSQYDAMLNYALTGDDKEKVTATGNGHYGSAIETGKTPTDKILNIFDLEGNYREWTLEAYTYDHRVARGGCYNDPKNNQKFTPSSRSWLTGTDNTNGEQSTRFTLYICNNK